MSSTTTVHSKYQKAVSKLLSLADFERKSRANDPPDFHLKRIERLLSYLDNPHHGQKYVHVAGSKGKGSTSAMTAWALAENGYKIGLFTSPSIHKITERIRINGTQVSEAEFASLVNNLWPAVEKVTADGDIGIVSVFELETAMAFYHFANAGADISVIEVGLGGRLDSTNVITPLVSVITPISLDHVAVLGDTIPQIASEKAGIIKPGVPVISSPQLPEANEVIKTKAAERNSDLSASESVVSINDQQNLGLNGVKVDFQIDQQKIPVHIKMLGDHQIDNARTALATLNQLSKVGVTSQPSKSATGISKVEWHARNQLVSTHPVNIFVDGAHNDASARVLKNSIEKLFPKRCKLIVILSVVRGHDPAAVARELLPLNPIFITTQTRHPKSLTNSELSEALGASKISINASSSSTHGAIEQAKKIASKGDLILGAGSLFVASEIVEIEHGIEPELYPDIKLPPRP
tara:strand:+ start:257 stop:1651 length:1395 start_codon:yes stop_codon:yes gene_type:complete